MPTKTYASATRSIAAVYRVLAANSSAEHPMSVSEILKKMEQTHTENPPSADTLKRNLPQWGAAISALFPHQALQADDLMRVLQTYFHNNTLHVIVEDRAGAAFAEGEWTPVLEPDPALLPSYSALEKLLQSLSESPDLFPFRLRCLAQVRGKYGHRLIPYVDWELQAGEQHSNRPRLYYLESLLTDAEWRMLYDLVQVYPYISESQTARFLDVLHRLAPNAADRVQSRYAFKRGSEEQFRHIAALDRAIREKTVVQITYGTYVLRETPDGLTPVLERRSSAGQFLLCPYATIWSNGYYYLVGKEQGSGVMRNLRVDRILTVSPQIETFQPDPTFDPYQYRDRSPVMYPGQPQVIRLRCAVSLVNTVLDFFGPQAHFSQLSGDTVTVTVNLAPAGVQLFALQYLDRVEVLDPPSLREAVIGSLQAGIQKYQSGIS